MPSDLLALVNSVAAALGPVTAEGKTSTRNHTPRWVRLCQEFLRCHRRPINILLHLITTPLGLFGLLALIHAASWLAPVVFIVAYAAVLIFLIPTMVWLATSVALAGLLLSVHYLAPGWVAATACLVVGYLGQDLAHWFAHERTLQSTYAGKTGMVNRLIEHTILLLPVLLAISARHSQSPLRLLVSRKAVLWTQLTSPRQREDLTTIRDWVQVSQPNLTQSTHWWQHDLSEQPRQAFNRLSQDEQLMSMIRRFHGPGYKIEPVHGMNELYVTGPPKTSTSDTVFYMGHVDGPWSVFPGAYLYRCMVAASPNAEVTTHFPMSGTSYKQPEGYRLETGEAVAFDFNRELHYITRQPSPQQTQPRVNLKLHYLAYPASLPWYGNLLAKLTTNYDVRARHLFLQTINPDRFWQRLKTKWVLGCTKIFELAVRYVGWTNLAYVLLMGAISLGLSDFRWFVATTSFVHYGIYLGTFREKSPVAFGIFRRNAVFYKTLAMAQLFLLYTTHFSNKWLSLGIVTAGFSLATYATVVLGMNRSYFSAELGFDPPKLIKRFPYGIIPHPMVLGAMLGIAGMLLLPDLRSSYAWLLVAHLLCYAAVLLQEIFSTRSSEKKAGVNNK